VVLSGCGGGLLLQQHKPNYDLWIQQEARLYDIPILIDAQPEEQSLTSFEDGSFCFSYISFIKIDDAISFSLQEMERMGWNLIHSFHCHETVLCFEKPHKTCLISIRPGKERLKVVIFLKNS
jgi:hypothetical protein